jgi:hypothetical protein
MDHAALGSPDRFTSVLVVIGGIQPPSVSKAA